ncbi:hypothetical protein Pelo_17283 [Pelomyxa schiedti]|nr:hypothetical protein Pelo_17283 [Pelomyxa schiedti]
MTFTCRLGFDAQRGSQYDYCDDYSKNPAVSGFVCCVCKAPWVVPVTHSDCGETFCATCIKPATVCPGCEMPFSPAQMMPFRAVSILNTLDSLKVRCPSCREPFPRKDVATHWQTCKSECPHGCGEKVAPDEFEAHVAQGCRNAIVVCTKCFARGKKEEILSVSHEEICPFSCPNGCGCKVTAKDVTQHNELCTELMITCTRCNEQVKRGKYVLEHSTSCSIPCECGALIPPKSLLSHLASGCKLAPVPCRGSALLCPWTGPLTHRDEHEKTCRFLSFSDILQPLLLKISGDYHSAREYNKSGQHLASQDFSRRCLRCWDFSGADISGCNFEGSDLSCANLSGATACGANFAHAKLKEANLQAGNFASSNFRGAKIVRADLSKASFANANFSNAILRGSNLSSACFTNSRLIDVMFIHKKTESSTWTENFWRPNTDGHYRDKNCTVQNPSANVISIVADMGVKIGQRATWNISIISGGRIGVGVSLLTAVKSLMPGEGTWFITKSIMYLDGHPSPRKHSFLKNGITIKCALERRPLKSLFTINCGVSSVEFAITSLEELYPFVVLGPRGDELSTTFIELTPILSDVVGFESALLTDSPNASASCVIATDSNSTSSSTPFSSSINSVAAKSENWQMTDASSLIFSKGNLSVMNATTRPYVIMATFGIPWGGSKYWESQVLQATKNFAVGVACEYCKPGEGMPLEKGVWKWESSGKVFSNGHFMEHNWGFSEGDSIGICLDRRSPAGTIIFTKNGKIIISLRGAGADKGILYPMAILGGSGDSLTASFTATEPLCVTQFLSLSASKPPASFLEIATTTTSTASATKTGTINTSSAAAVPTTTKGKEEDDPFDSMASSLASSDDFAFGTPKLTIGYNSSSSSEKLPRLEEIKRPQLKRSGSASPNSSLSGLDSHHGLFSRSVSRSRSRSGSVGLFDSDS